MTAHFFACVCCATNINFTVCVMYGVCLWYAIECLLRKTDEKTNYRSKTIQIKQKMWVSKARRQYKHIEQRWIEATVAPAAFLQFAIPFIWNLTLCNFLFNIDVLLYYLADSIWFDLRNEMGKPISCVFFSPLSQSSNWNVIVWVSAPLYHFNY